MSTAVAPATVPQVPLAPPPSEPESSPQTSFHARSSPNQAERSIASAAPRTNSPNAPIVVSEGTAKPRITPDSKRSPLSYVQSSLSPPTCTSHPCSRCYCYMINRYTQLTSLTARGMALPRSSSRRSRHPPQKCPPSQGIDHESWTWSPAIPKVKGPPSQTLSAPDVKGKWNVGDA